MMMNRWIGSNLSYCKYKIYNCNFCIYTYPCSKFAKGKKERTKCKHVKMIFVNEDRESKWRLGTVFVCADSACEKQINVVEHDD